MSTIKKLVAFTTSDVNESLTFNYNSETKEISIIGSLGGTETEKLNLGVMKDISDPTASALAIPTKVSQLENDSNFITGYTDNEFKNRMISVISLDVNFKNWLVQNLSALEDTTPSTTPPPSSEPVVQPDLYIPSGIVDYTPLTFESTGNTTVRLIRSGQKTDFFSYKLNDGQWQDYTVGDIIELSDGDKVAISGNNEMFSSDGDIDYRFVTDGEGTLKLYGNIMALIGFRQALNEYEFYYLFEGNCKNLVDISELSLPALVLKHHCYKNMFRNCTGLTAIMSSLPAIVLDNYCYEYMFGDCTSLTSAPSLPATNLATGCYRDMFTSCSSLTTPPSLPATIMTKQCYWAMFNYCYSLSSAPQLPATTLADSCYKYMFWHCHALSTAPSLPATTLAKNCYQEMFNECTALSSITLPATTLAQGCYQSMFNKCTSLISIEVAFTSWDNVGSWVGGVSKNGTFIKPYFLPEIYGTYNIPEGWTVVNKD